jgi:YYY domain-containing protein
MSGYILWLGGTFQLLQNNVGGIVASVILVLAIGLIWRWQQRRAGDSLSMLAWLRQEWRYALTVELLFSLAFGAWAVFKAYNPNIETAGGEKWMEIAFINGTLRSDYFPPQDPWLSGFAISYYYFGYVLMAMVTQLTGLLSVVAFNLYVPTLLAMTIAGALGITANLVSLYQSSTNSSLMNQQSDGPTNQSFSQPALIPKLTAPAILTGLVASLFVALMGHLEGLLEVLHKQALLPPGFWVWLDIRDLKEPPIALSDSWIPDRFIWWWRGSRVLTDYTLTGQEQEVIDEFPFFSFLLGDVHPHVLALPFVLLVVALALNLIANVKNDRLTAGATDLPQTAGLINKLVEILRKSWQALTEATGGRLAFVIYAVSLGGLSFLNTWDFPIYLSVVGLTLIMWLWYRNGDGTSAIQQGIIGTVYLGLAGVILYLPFYATFQSQARGILPNLWNPTRLPQFFVFFGPFLVATLGLLIVLSSQGRAWRKQLSWTLPLTILGPVLAMLVALTGVLISPAGREYVQGILNNPEVQQLLGNTTIGALVQESLWRRVLNPWTFLLLGGVLGWVLALLIGDPPNQPTNATSNHPASQPTTKFVLILLLVGLGLPLAVELVYLRDNFGIRMNTIFKFYFQAWVMLALVSAFAVYYVSKSLRGIPALVWQVSMVLLVAASMIYPVLAVADKANYFKNEPTLNGAQWIANYQPGDYAAIEWLRANAPDDAVVLEAPGARYAAYQYTGRVSALTGLPTLLGWGGHQSQWRGNYDEPARREPEIEALFNSSDLGRTQELLDKYNITYIYVGPLERERYSPQGLNKFARLMDVVFQQDDVIIYQRR